MENPKNEPQTPHFGYSKDNVTLFKELLRKKTPKNTKDISEYIKNKKKYKKSKTEKIKIKKEVTIKEKRKKKTKIRKKVKININLLNQSKKLFLQYYLLLDRKVKIFLMFLQKNFY